MVLSSQPHLELQSSVCHSPALGLCHCLTLSLGGTGCSVPLEQRSDRRVSESGDLGGSAAAGLSWLPACLGPEPAALIGSLAWPELKASLKPFQAFEGQEQRCRGSLAHLPASFVVAYAVRGDLLLLAPGEWPQSPLLPPQALQEWGSHWQVPPGLPSLPALWSRAVCHEALVPPSPGSVRGSSSAARGVRPSPCSHPHPQLWASVGS